MRVRLLYLMKGKKANEGEIRKWKSGYMMKVGTKWIRVEQKNGKWVKVEETKKPKAKPKDGVKDKSDAPPKKKAKADAPPKKKPKTEAVPKKKAKAVKVKKEEAPIIKEEPVRLSVRDYLSSKKLGHLQAGKVEKTLDVVMSYSYSRSHSRQEPTVRMTRAAFIEMNVYDHDGAVRERWSEDMDWDKRERDVHLLTGSKEGPFKEALRKKLDNRNSYRTVIGYAIDVDNDGGSWYITKTEYEYAKFLLENKGKAAAIREQTERHEADAINKQKRKEEAAEAAEAAKQQAIRDKAEAEIAANDAKNPYSKYNRLAETVIESISNNDLSTVKRAIKEHPDIVKWYHSKLHRTLLHNALLDTESPDMDIVKELIRAGSDVNARDRSGDSILHYAAYKGSAEEVQALIDAGAGESINAIGSEGTPLGYAAIAGFRRAESESEVVKKLNILIANGARIEVTGREYDGNVLHRIRSQAVGELLIRNASLKALNQQDSNGRTPLERIIGNGEPWSLPLVKELIRAGANINDNDNKKILNEAYSRWRANAEDGLPIIEELVRAGISKQEFKDYAEKARFGTAGFTEDKTAFYAAMDRI